MAARDVTLTLKVEGATDKPLQVVTAVPGPLVQIALEEIERAVVEIFRDARAKLDALQSEA